MRTTKQHPAIRRRARSIFRRSPSGDSRRYKPGAPPPPAPVRLYGSDAERPARSALGEHIIQVARAEAPTDRDRQRVLDGVLAALRQLTSGAA